MASVEKFEDLEVWQRARNLAKEIYAASSIGGFARDFVLRDQIRGAAVSVVSNIAEGFERGGNQEFLQFLSVAKGSAGEVRAQLYMALDQGYIDGAAFDCLRGLAVEVSGKLGGLIAYLKASGMKGSKYKVDELETLNPKPETLNPKPETLNPKPGTLNPEPGTLNPEPGTRNREAGFSIMTAIFLIVVLAALGVVIVSVTGLQLSGQRIDVQGVRAYQAARAGVEWAAWQVLDPNNTLNPATCGTAFVACPASPTTLPTLAGSLAPFTVTVTCSETAATEGNRQIRVFAITSTATTGTPATDGYINRQVQATLSKCHDPTAAAPRCSCG